MASARSQRAASILNSQLYNDNLVLQTKQQQGYVNKGIKALGQGVDTARTDLTNSLNGSLAALGQGYNTGVSAINSGFGSAIGSAQAGIDKLNPWVTQGAAANTMQGNALGINGAAGNQAATSAFQASPGYQWNVDQATDAAARKANALGISASGNTLDAITRLGSNLANQEYGNWYDRLTGVSTQGQAAANSQMQGYQNLGNLQAQQGSALAQLGQNYGQNQASAYNDYGKNLSSNAMAQGTGTAGLYQGLGSTMAAVNMNAVNGMASGNMAAAAASDAARNANSNLGLGLVSSILGLGLGGGRSVGGSIFSGLGNSLSGALGGGSIFK